VNILLLDNYDSFTYNLLHYLEKAGDNTIIVKRNDEIDVDEAGTFDRIVLSPGPGLPSESGIMPQLLKRYVNNKPILGVCLGHQAIAECFGGKLLNLEKVHHGIASELKVLDLNDPLYKGLPSAFKVGRYHSWVVSPSNFPSCLNISAIDEDGIIMSFKHKDLPVYGVQYHPESILSEFGDKLISNWLRADI
jgi:anthranilate synthase component 2